MNDFTHAYCDNCKAIQPVFVEELHPAVTPKSDKAWCAGDIVCKVCAWIVATVYAERRA